MPLIFVLSLPAPTIDLTTLQEEVASLHANVDSIFGMRGMELGSVPIKLAGDTMLDALFKPSAEPKSEPRS